jgi:hypothetical protein
LLPREKMHAVVNNAGLVRPAPFMRRGSTTKAPSRQED